MLKPERDAAPSHTAEDPDIGVLQFAHLSAAARAHPHLLSTDELLAHLAGLPSEWKNKIDRLRAKHEIQARERYDLVVERLVSELGTDLGPKLSHEATRAVLYVIWRDAIELCRAIGQAYLSEPPPNLTKLLENVAMLVIRDSNALMRQVSGGTWFQVASDAKPPRTDAAGSQPAAVSDEEERPATHEEIRLLCWLAESGADPCRCAESAEFSSDLRDRLIQQPSLSVGEVGRQILEEKARRSSGVTSFTVDQFGRFIPVEAADVGTSARREEIGPELPPLEPYRMDSDWWSPTLAENLMKAVEPELQDLSKTGRYRRYHGTEAEAAGGQNDGEARSAAEPDVEAVSAVPPRTAHLENGYVDKTHEIHMKIFDQVLEHVKLDAWCEDHNLKRTPVTDYRGGRIKGRIRDTKRAAIEKAIRDSAAEHRIDFNRQLGPTRIDSDRTDLPALHSSRHLP